MLVVETENEIGAPVSRLKDERYKLVGGVCGRCGFATMPAREVCPNCLSDQIDRVKFKGKGTVLTYTTVVDHPNFEEAGPVTVALIKLDEGVVLTAQIADPDEHLKIGSPVEMVIRVLQKGGDRGIIKYGYKFTVTENTNQD